MAIDLVVDESTEVVLNERPPTELQPAFRTVQIRTLKDLVEVGFIESEEMVNKLLDAAKYVTEAALARPATFTPFVPVVGTSWRTDLRRFGAFRAASGDVRLTEIRAFWDIAREIEPYALSRVTATTALDSLGLPPGRLAAISKIIVYLFNDVTVKVNSVLTMAPKIKRLKCRHLLIEKGGRIRVNSSFFKIDAFSIRGMQ
jgi:hypothetical protein